MFLEIWQNSQENTCVRVSPLLKPEACNFIKKRDSGTGVSCEIREISKNTFFYRTPLVAASVTWGKDPQIKRQHLQKV